MRLPAVLALTLLALAGCSSPAPKPEPYACPDGTVIAPEAVPGHDEEGFDPALACPQPVAPSVALVTVPATMSAYRPATVRWQVLNGSYAHGHSMLTSLRVGTASVPDAQLAGPDTFGAEVAKREHQNVPSTHEATVRLSQPGTYYLRAYAVVRADGLADGDHWSPEATLVVGPVQPTGNATLVTHKQGDFAGGLDQQSVSLAIGDAVVFKNDDVRDHAFTFEAVPEGAARPEPVTVAASGAVSPPVVLVVPGAYTVKTDDLMPATLQVSVSVPA